MITQILSQSRFRKAKQRTRKRERSQTEDGRLSSREAATRAVPLFCLTPASVAAAAASMLLPSCLDTPRAEIISSAEHATRRNYFKC